MVYGLQFTVYSCSFSILLMNTNHTDSHEYLIETKTDKTLSWVSIFIKIAFDDDNA